MKRGRDEDVPAQYAFYDIYQFFNCNRAFFCSNYLEPGETTISEAERVKRLTLLIDDEQEREYACDFILLRTLLRQTLNVSDAEDINPTRYQQFVNTEAMDSLSQLISTTSQLFDKISEEEESNVDEMLRYWRTHKLFLLAPFDSKTKPDLDAFLAPGPEETEEQKNLESHKQQFREFLTSLNTLLVEPTAEQYYMAMTGRTGYELGAQGYRGLYDNHTKQVQEFFQQNLFITLPLYENKEFIAQMSGLYQTYLLNTSPQKFIDFLDQDHMFDFFKKLYLQSWSEKLETVETSNNALDKLKIVSDPNDEKSFGVIKRNGLNHAIIDKCKKLIPEITDKTIKGIIQGALSDQEKLQQIHTYLQSNLLLAARLVEKQPDIEYLACALRNQKKIHFNEGQDGDSKEIKGSAGEKDSDANSSAPNLRGGLFNLKDSPLKPSPQPAKTQSQRPMRPVAFKI